MRPADDAVRVRWEAAEARRAVAAPSSEDAESDGDGDDDGVRDDDHT